MGELYPRVRAVLEGMELPGGYEMVFINDGSHDQSLTMLLALAARDEWVRYIDLSRNFGHQIAVSAGLDHVAGNAVVIIDAYLQDPPELIPELYRKLREGCEVVYAKRRSRQGESVAKNAQLECSTGFWPASRIFPFR